MIVLIRYVINNKPPPHAANLLWWKQNRGWKKIQNMSCVCWVILYNILQVGRRWTEQTQGERKNSRWFPCYGLDRETPPCQWGNTNSPSAKVLGFQHSATQWWKKVWVFLASVSNPQINTVHTYIQVMHTYSISVIRHMMSLSFENENFFWLRWSFCRYIEVKVFKTHHRNT